MEFYPKHSWLITGATGYIGSMLVKKLNNETPDADITVIVRSRAKAEAMLPRGIRILEADLTDTGAVSRIDGRFDYVVHCACVTKSREMVTRPTETVKSIVNATQNVLDLAVRNHAKSAVYVSSMEVYGDMRCPDGRRCGEDEAGAGRVDILSARSCYPLAKRMAENICCSFYVEYGLPVKIARLAQTFGKGVLPGEGRVFAQFEECAAHGSDIVLHTEGKSVGNYCEIEDALEGILTVLHKGKPGEAYNIVNEACTMRIREVAGFVAERIAGGEISVRFDIPEDDRFGYAPDTGLMMSGEKLKGLGWEPHKGLEEMFRDMLNSRA